MYDCRACGGLGIRYLSQKNVQVWEEINTFHILWDLTVYELGCLQVPCIFYQLGYHIRRPSLCDISRCRQQPEQEHRSNCNHPV